MKKKKIEFSPKLFLDKKSLVALNNEQANVIIGGVTEIHDPAVTGGCGPCNFSVGICQSGGAGCETQSPSRCPSVPNAQGLCCSIIP